MNVQEAKDKFVDILRDDLRIRDWRDDESNQDMRHWFINSSNLRTLYNLFDEIDTIEKQVKIPEFVAEWVEKCKAEGEACSLTSLFRTPIYIDEWLEKSDYNYELIYSAYVNGYELLEEKTFYAKIKGWDKIKDYDGSQSELIYWNYNIIEDLLFLSNKTDHAYTQTIATIERWEELGIDQSNAVFEEV